ncbi:sorbitol dehydrogenase-like isoform X3, partial [Dinothrombium tinctorium]
VLICGAGPIGVLSMLCAKAVGAAKICIIGKLGQALLMRLDFASSFGADVTILVDRNDDPKALANTIVERFGEADVTLECTGAQLCTHAALLSSRRGAKIAIVGVGPEVISVPLCEVLFRELDVVGSLKFKNNFPLVLYLLESGKINVKPLITHMFPIEEAKSALQIMVDQKAMKILIEC